MKTYSQDLRDRVIEAYKPGQTTQEEVAERFAVTARWIRKLLARLRQSGSCAALPHSGGQEAKFKEEHKERLQQLVAEQPDATLEELRERCGAPVSIATISRALKELGLALKKKPARQRTRARGRAA